jgi:sugar lactone lactonase YvrE
MHIPATISVLCTILTIISTQPNLITVNFPNLYPEGIEWSQKTGTLLSSTTMGTVYKISDDGTATPFVSNPRLISSVGIHIDSNRNELLVCNTASFVRCDLDTGDVKQFIDLSLVRRPGYNGTQFINDVVSDKDGNAYVTDSRASVVYKIDVMGIASIFAYDTRWDTGVRVGLNGIEISADSTYLLVGHTIGQIYKVLIANSSSITLVTIPQMLTGLDGMVIRPNGDLVVVGNSVQKVYLLQSNDDWTSASILLIAPSNYPVPTTAALRDGDVYVNHAYFGYVNETSFEIERIPELYVAPTNNSSTVGWIILLLILCIIFVGGVSAGIFLFIRKRQQRYRQFHAEDLATTEFDDDRKKEKEAENDDWE